MAKEHAKATGGNEITRYNNAQGVALGKICKLLHQEIGTILTSADSRIYYGMPVWFIHENPIVGYGVKSKAVNLLFWSGQLFTTPGLTAAGKYKAAQIKFKDASELNTQLIRQWLKESKTKIWDYKTL